MAAPTAPFPQSVLALNPVAYWRLNEPDDGTYDGNPGTIAYDYVGGNDGIYTNALLGQPGYNLNTDATETSAYFGYIAPTDCFVGQIGTNIDFSTPAGSNAEFTIEAWVNGLDSKPTDSSGAGIVAKGYFGTQGSAEVTLDEGAPNEDFRLEVHTPDNTAYDANSTINAQSTGWHFLVGVCDEANSNVLLYVDGVLAGSTRIPALSGIINTAGVPLMIGARSSSALTGGNNQFVGLINDVAVFNRALSPDEVLSQYLAAGISPNFLQQPAMNAFVTANGLAVENVTIIGTPLLTEQWWDATLNAPIAGQTNAALTITNIVTADSLVGHQLYLNVTNIYGATNSALVTVNSNSSPVITAQFPVSYTNQITLYAGASPTFSISATTPAGEPISYFWFTNGVGAANATNAAYQLTNVQLDSPTNFFCVASNVAGTTTSMVWSVTYLAAPAAPFVQSVLALNPVAYWRLNEADDGINDGNPGALAIDYVGGNNAIYTNVVLGQTGYNVSADPTATAALFGTFTPTGSFAGQIGTNIDFSAPAGSNAEFTIEAWVNGLGYKPTNSSGAGIVAKGYFGSKGSAEMTLDEGAANEDFRLEVHSPANKASDANSTINAQNSGWHFLVGVCDEANSNVLLYVDGVVAGRTAIAPLTGIINTAAVPLMIGARSTSVTSVANNQFQGLIDNVAVYNYALTPNQIATQYQAGTGLIVNTTATNIVFSALNNKMTLSWPADHTGWQLQAQTNSLGTNWVTVGGSSLTNQVNMVIDPSNKAVFYRLIYSK
ncbi:MAG: LamG-like jellyroll fold domain-containing protein [Limisphaerales bacterium]